MKNFTGSFQDWIISPKKIHTNLDHIFWWQSTQEGMRRIKLMVLPTSSCYCWQVHLFCCWGMHSFHSESTSLGICHRLKTRIWWFEWNLSLYAHIFAYLIPIWWNYFGRRRYDLVEWGVFGLWGFKRITTFPVSILYLKLANQNVSSQLFLLFCYHGLWFAEITSPTLIVFFN